MHRPPPLPSRLWNGLPAAVQAALWRLVDQHIRELRELQSELTSLRARLEAPAAAVASLPPPGAAESAAASAEAAPSRPRVSLCLIVRNEEANLPTCLASVAGLCDEIVVVDTGSTDRTRALAAQAGACVHDFPWQDSFAAARNECLRHARGAWIFWLDADESLDPDNRRKLEALFAGLDDQNVGYLMRQQSMLRGDQGRVYGTDQVRLFRNDPALRWQYRVHEQILPAIRRLGGQARRTDIAIQHHGYQDPALSRRKQERNLAALLLDHAEHPADAFILFNLGWTYQALGQPHEAQAFLERSLERARPDAAFLPKLYAQLVRLHRQQGHPDQALALCRAGLVHCPHEPELHYQQGMLHFARGEWSAAEAALSCVLEAPREQRMAIGENPGQRTYQARYNLGVLYRDQGRPVAAEAQWRRLLEQRPDYFPARLGLAELWLSQARWQEVAHLAAEREGQPQGMIDALLMRAKLCAARGDFAGARQLAEGAIAALPGALWPRLVLSQVLLQEDRHPGAIEQALRDVLTVDPGHAATRRNLETFLRKQARSAAAVAG